MSSRRMDPRWKAGLAATLCGRSVARRGRQRLEEALPLIDAAGSKSGCSSITPA